MFFFFFFNDTATTEIYTLSLHDALPIYCVLDEAANDQQADHQHHAADQQETEAEVRFEQRVEVPGARQGDRSEEHTSELHHANISYAVFCLKKKKIYNYINFTLILESKI